MSRKIWITAISVVVVGLVIILTMMWGDRSDLPTQSGPDVQTAPIKVGANITLSGQISYWGEQVKKGLDVAVSDANRDTELRPIEILYQDNQGEAKNAISIFQRFATLEKVSCVLSIFTPVSKPLRPLAEQNRIPLLATVVSAVGFGLENEWSFRDFPSQTQQAIAVAQYAYNDLGSRSAVSLVVNDDYGRDGETVFVEEFAQLGGEILGTDTVDQSARDIRAQATKLIALNPDCLFIVIRDTTLGLAVKQFRELGFKGKIVGVNAFDAPVVWEAAGDAGEGCVFTSAYVDFEDNSEAKAFSQSYEAANSGETPDWVAVYGYTIGAYLCDILRAADGDPDAVRSALSSMQGESIRGPLKMNSDRDVVSPVGVYERRSGKNIVLKML